MKHSLFIYSYLKPEDKAAITSTHSKLRSMRTAEAGTVLGVVARDPRLTLPMQRGRVTAGEPRPSPGDASSCAAAAWELQRSALWSAGARHAMSVLRLSDHEINSARRAGTVSSVSGGHIVKSFLVQLVRS